MLKLYHEIIKYYPDFDSDSFSRNTLSVNSSLSGTHNESTLRDALSDLMRVTLRFLTISNFENNDYESANLIMEELLQRNSSKIVQKKIRDGKEFFDSNSFFDSRYQYNKYWFSSLAYNYESANTKIIHKTKALEKVDKLSHLSFTLLSFYIPEVVSLYLNAKMMSEKYNLDFAESPLSKLGESLDINNLIRIYEHESPQVFMLYKLLLDMFNNFEKEQYYLRYKDFVKQNKNNLSADEISFHYNWLINYCILKKSTENQYDFDEELFYLYNVLLENNYYINRTSKFLSVDLFRDILILAINSKKYDWTEEFIRRFQQEVNPEERENIINFSYAYLYFSLGDSLKALGYYQKIKMDTFVYKYDIKILALKIYTELNYFEEILSEIKTFREFLRNNPMVSPDKRIRFGNFVKYLEKMVLYMAGNEKVDINYIRRKIIQEKSLTQKKWLLDKINSLPKIRLLAD